MVASLFSIIAGFIIYIISSFGYLGIFICMTIESACIPLPSEIIMPFSGFLVCSGKFELLGVVFAGVIGNLAGSSVMYWIGFTGGREFVEKHGKYLLISKKELDRADHWFNKFGDRTVFVARMLPIIRTFISLPAGISKMNYARFSALTFIGSIPWCFALSLIGMKLGENWAALRIYFERFDILILSAIVALFIFWIGRHFNSEDI